jgi:nucleoside-diphosphate-sugar epimerase
VTVVRPPALYGPGDPETLSLFQAAGSSPVLPLFDPAARISMMHVADAAAQIAALAGGAAPAGATVTLCDQNPAGYSWREIVEAAARATGGRPRLVRAPDGLIALAAWLARMVPSPAAPMLSPGKAREIRHLDWSVHASERAHSGVLPAASFDINDGFSATVGGYRAIGVLR